MMRFITYSILWLLLISCSAFFVLYIESDEDIFSGLLLNTKEESAEYAEQQPLDIFFVGDIMLGRSVETFMGTGTATPFEYVGGLLSEPAITVGNFEGVVSEVHEHALNMTYRFSIKDEYLRMLKTEGFDVLSLANNHSLDYGTTSLAYTRSLCDAYGFVCGGSPLNREVLTTRVVEKNGLSIGFLFIHTLYSEVSTTTLASLLEDLNNRSDVQVAYAHWGEEYELVHNKTQEELAHILIDGGIDAVIGHHPHVVQDIEIYMNKPIFYSLGNFIFDQYFSVDVQEMIGVTMQISNDVVSYSVLPFTTVNSHMQPQLLEGERKDVLYNRIFAMSRDIPGVVIDEGSIIVPR